MLYLGRAVTHYFHQGVVRYRSPQSLRRAKDRFETSEIVVQDVAVMLKILKRE